MTTNEFAAGDRVRPHPDRNWQSHFAPLAARQCHARFIWTKTSGNEWSVRRAKSDGYPEDFNRVYVDGVLARAFPGSPGCFGINIHATSGGFGGSWR